METQEKIALIENALELEEGTLALDTILDDVEEYDSMAKLALIVVADDEFGIKLTSDMVREFVTVGDIVKILER